MAAKQAEFDSGIKVDGTANLNGDVQVSGNLNVTGSMVFTGTSTGDLNPSSNNAYFLGNSSFVWTGAILNNFVSNATATLFRNIAPTFLTSNNTVPSFVVPHGTAPSSPANGSIWTTSAGLFVQISNVTKNLATVDGTVNVASQLQTARHIKILGDATGSATFDGTANADITITLASSYYTTTAADARFANLSAPIFTGLVSPSSNGIGFGNTTKRWAVFATTGNYSANLDVSGNAAFANNVTVTGNLTVQGSPIDVTAGHITTTANGITFTGGGTTNSNIIITRGVSANAVIRWDEVADVFKLSNGGSYYKIVFEDNTSPFAISISGNAANATHATTAANSVNLNGQNASYYTDIVSRLGYTPANKAGDTGLGSLTPAANTTSFGNTTQRWVIAANTLDLSSTLSVSGLATLTTANVTGATQLRGNTTLFANVTATTNAAAIRIGNTIGRVIIYANTIDASGTITGTLAGTANNADNFGGQLPAYYLNASNMATGTVPDARLPKANSTANGILIVLDSVTNTSITVAAAANSVKRAYDTAVSLSGAAYSNAITFAANATNLGNGTVENARLNIATSGQFRANTTGKILTTDIVWAEANIVSLVDGANVAVDMSGGFNFTVTLAGNRNIDNPSNAKPGQSGILIIKQDGTGSRTATWSSNWKFPGGTDPTLSTTASATDVVSYFVESSTSVLGSIAKAFA